MWSLLLWTTLCTAQYVPNLKPDTRSLDEIYEAAKQEEGVLQVVFGGDAGSQGNPLREAWKTRFPDVALNLTVDLSKYLDNQIDRDFYENKSIVDVAVLQSLQDYPRWKADNRLLYYKPQNFADLLEGEKDFQGAWLPVQIVSFGTIFYNENLLDLPLPTSFYELADPKWAGKLILTHPNDDDAVGYLFSLITLRYGFDWFIKLGRNDVFWDRGTATSLYDWISNSTKRSLTFTSIGTGDALPSYIKTASVRYPEQIMSWAQRSAILSSTQRPESAKLMQAFLASEEWQKISSGSGPSALTSLNAQKGVTPYSSNITQISGYEAWSNDRARVEWWRFFYEDIIGFPKGPDPIVRYPNPSHPT